MSSTRGLGRGSVKVLEIISGFVLWVIQRYEYKGHIVLITVRSCRSCTRSPVFESSTLGVKPFKCASLTAGTSGHVEQRVETVDGYDASGSATESATSHP